MGHMQYNLEDLRPLLRIFNVIFQKVEVLLIVIYTWLLLLSKFAKSI